MGICQLDRRAFLLSGAALAIGRSNQPPPLRTLSDWLGASVDARRRALAPLLTHIRAVEPSVQAWVHVAPRPSSGRGPLAEIPFAVKDVLETRDLPTEYGSPVYKGRRGTEDAAIVTTLCDLGGVLLGKTHTAAFAFRTPPPTHNPRDLAHTPGGSSSGSAAAVAADMAPLAVGTQTGGSTIRPASYCGVTGFKPSYGLFSTAGVLTFSKSLDTLGFFTHRAADMLAFWQQVLGRAVGAGEGVAVAAMDPLPEIEASMASAFKASIARLRAAGVPLRPVDIGAMVLKLHDAQQTVAYYEGARVHAERFATYGDRLLDLADLVRKGRELSDASYHAALGVIADARQRVDGIYRETPVILSPAATGPAPSGLGSTGDSRLNSAWTALGTPAISIPMPTGGTLPLGLQITAAHGQDQRVLRAAAQIETMLVS
jgi:Asp-tRNA(Asn)/Glu-tRNA(Gln) amidotransferase A subunit family amidase